MEPPTSDYKSGWLFFQFQRFRRSWSSTTESVEAVQNGGPAKAQRSGFGGERRSNGMTELLPRKAKRRMWSLRRRDGPKSRKLHPARPKEVPLGETRRMRARLPSSKALPQGIQGAANRGPAKAQRSGFGGERRSSGTTELLPRKAKRRMWSLRRRGTPFSPIFRRATKDGATGGRWFSREVGKKRAK